VLPEIEKKTVEDALKQTNGVKVKAAEILGISRGILNRKIKKYNIKLFKFNKSGTY